jgi:putative transposase
MGRGPRVDIGGEIYHVINRANGRLKIFYSDADYRLFEEILAEAKQRMNMRLLGYTLMPNHWHLIPHPHSDGDLSTFMHWLTLTHTQQYRARTETVGDGHLYQDRYKSFLIEGDVHLLQVLRYVERNPVRAKLVKHAEEWQWGSARTRFTFDSKKPLIDDLPVDLPNDYRVWLNESETDDSLVDIRESVNKGKPFGCTSWVDTTIKAFGLKPTRKEGRPPNENKQ